MRSFLSCLFLALGACAHAPSPAPSFPTETVARLDAAVADEMRSGNLPSVAVGLFVPGEGRYVRAIGPDRLDAAPNSRDPGDPFRIASITKTFTATAILMLADDGRLRLTDKLATWYPQFPNADAITVTDLLRMRSGIPDVLDKRFIAEYYADPRMVLGPDEVIARAAAQPSKSFDPPDTKTVYTNVNFVLLERIVEKASGQDIRSFLQTRILDRVGLSHTSYPRGPVLDSPLHGYAFEPSTGRFADRTVLNPGPAGGAGAIVSTLDDLHRWTRVLCRGDLLAPDTQSRRLVTTAFEGGPALVGYGEGIARLGRFCGHNGTIFGFSSEAWYLPEKDAVIVINVARLDEDDQSRSFKLFARVAKVAFPDLVDW